MKKNISAAKRIEQSVEKLDLRHPKRKKVFSALIVLSLTFTMFFSIILMLQPDPDSTDAQASSVTGDVPVWRYAIADGSSADNAYISGHDDPWAYNRYIFLAFKPDIPAGATITDVNIHFYNSGGNTPVAFNWTNAFYMTNSTSRYTDNALDEISPAGSLVEDVTVPDGGFANTGNGMDSEWQTQFDNNGTIYMGLSAWDWSGTVTSNIIAIKVSNVPHIIVTYTAPPARDILRPISDQYKSELTASTGSDKYAMVDETTAGGNGDTDYDTNTLGTGSPKWQHFDITTLSDRPGYSISNVTIWGVMKRIYTSTTVIQLGMKQTDYNSTAYYHAFTITSSYVNYSWKWVTQPWTSSTAWTLSAVNAMVIYVYGGGFRITQMAVLVNWTEDALPPTWAPTFNSITPYGMSNSSYMEMIYNTPVDIVLLYNETVTGALYTDALFLDIASSNASEGLEITNISSAAIGTYYVNVLATSIGGGLGTWTNWTLYVYGLWAPTFLYYTNYGGGGLTSHTEATKYDFMFVFNETCTLTLFTNASFLSSEVHSNHIYVYNALYPAGTDVVPAGDSFYVNIRAVSTVGTLTSWYNYTLTLTLLDIIDPVADAGPDQTVYVGVSMNFDGSASTDNIAVTDWDWTFTDGTPQTVSGVSAAYTWTTLGAHVVTLTVYDAESNSDTDTMTVTVLTVPLANAGPDRTERISSGGSVTLDASLSTTAVYYNWTIRWVGNATIYGYSNGTNAERAMNFLVGNFTCTLNITDALGGTDEDVFILTTTPYETPATVKYFRWLATSGIMLLIGSMGFLGMILTPMFYLRRREGGGQGLVIAIGMWFLWFGLFVSAVMVSS
jgi:hypothetical protein